MDFICKTLKFAYSQNAKQNDVEKIVNLSKGRIQYYFCEKNENLVSVNQKLTCVLFVIKGSYMVTRLSEKGQLNIIGEKDAPRILSTILLTTENEMALADITALQRCEIISIEKNYLLKMMAMDQDISLMIIDSLSKTLREDTDRLDQHVFNSSIENFMIYIYYKWTKSDAIGNYPFVIADTNQKIADSLNVSLRTLYRILKEAKALELIQTSGRKIVIEEDAMTKIIDIAERLI